MVSSELYFCYRYQLNLAARQIVDNVTILNFKWSKYKYYWLQKLLWRTLVELEALVKGYECCILYVVLLKFPSRSSKSLFVAKNRALQNGIPVMNSSICLFVNKICSLSIYLNFS